MTRVDTKPIFVLTRCMSLPKHVIQCISCGREISFVTTFDLSDYTRTTATIQMQHDGPMDAACQLVFEALEDEHREMLNRRMRAAKQQIDEYLTER